MFITLQLILELLKKMEDDIGKKSIGLSVIFMLHYYDFENFLIDGLTGGSR